MKENILIGLLLVNQAYIGLLPFVFFRRDGRFHMMWWLTGLPFWLASVVLLLAGFEKLTPYSAGEFQWIANWIAMIASAGSISLISYTIGTHRVPLALWHQNNDAPKNIVTYGAYRLIRHPFYTSFLLSLVACVLVVPHIASLATLAYGFFILNLTAAREEKRLSASQFGDEYKAYLGRTGRFCPRLMS